MKCRGCGNTKRFTKVKETAHWNDKKKKAEDVGQGAAEYWLCDSCMNFGTEGRYTDTEGDY